MQKSDPEPIPPPGYWWEEHTRGGAEIFILFKGPDSVGSITVHSLAEKEAWTIAVWLVNQRLGIS